MSVESLKLARAVYAEQRKKPDARTLKLNSREEAFCQYMTMLGTETLGHRTNSAIQAGYSRKRAAVTGSQLCKKQKIQERIEKLTAKNLRSKGVTAQSIVTDLLRIQEKTETEGKYSDTLRALELLGRTLGMYSDRVTLDTAEIQEFSERKRAELRKLAKLSVMADIRPPHMLDAEPIEAYDEE